MSEPIITIPAALKTKLQTIINRGTELDEGYRLLADHMRATGVDDNRLYWFDNAQNVNRYANVLSVAPDSDAASRFIYATASIGLQLNGDRGLGQAQQLAQVRKISNDIAKGTLDDIAEYSRMALVHRYP